MQFLYLILSIYFGRKNPLFFLIFPLALMQGPGALIDPRTTLIASEYFVLGKNIFKDITVIYLFSVVLFLSKRVNYSLIFKSPIIYYVVYLVFLILLTYASNGGAYEAFSVARLFLYMVLGFFLLLLIFSTVDNKQLIQFINVLLWVNIVGSVLYVLNSSKVFSIFNTEMLYREVEYENGIFVRDFSTIPIFSNLLFIVSFASIVLKEENRFNRSAIFLTLGTYPFVLLYTFTRSLLVSTLMELLIVVFVLLMYRPSIIIKSKLIPVLLAGICLFTIITFVFKNEFGYFNERVEGAVEEGANDQNLDIRIQYHQRAWEILKRENLLVFGGGINKHFEDEMGKVGAYMADSTIPYILITTGVVGVLVFYILCFWFVVKAFFAFKMKKDAFILALFSIFCFSIIASFIMGGLPWGSPFFFFNQVFILYLIEIKRNPNLKKTVGNIDRYKSVI